MTEPLLPLIVEPEELEKHLGDEKLLIVDLGKPENYARAHVPGAVHLAYAQIIASRPPVMGLLPDEKQLSEVFSNLGLTSARHVVAYDDEGNGRASRLLWTLDTLGHGQYSLLNGGLHAWLAEERPLESEPVSHPASTYQARITAAAQADKAYIQAHLNDPAVVLLDARNPAEYTGELLRAAMGGHIPGAVNFEWLKAIDQRNQMRHKPAQALREELAKLGVTPDKEIITYCQTHHRSAHTYIALKALGFKNVKGYPGSWSEWGNSPDLPVED